MYFKFSISFTKMQRMFYNKSSDTLVIRWYNTLFKIINSPSSVALTFPKSEILWCIWRILIDPILSLHCHLSILDYVLYFERFLFYYQYLQKILSIFTSHTTCTSYICLCNIYSDIVKFSATSIISVVFSNVFNSLSLLIDTWGVYSILVLWWHTLNKIH